MQMLFFLILAFLIGSIPSGILLARFFKLTDPREMGSGNIGAANMTRVGGKKLGILTLLADFSKGALPVLFVSHYLQAPSEIIHLVALFCVLGHCYSVFLSFSGGKGVATAAGVLSILVPMPMLIGFIAWLLCFFAFKVTSLSALCAVIIIPISVVSMEAGTHALLLSVCISLIIFRRHLPNLELLLSGKERDFGSSSNS